MRLSLRLMLAMSGVVLVAVATLETVAYHGARESTLRLALARAETSTRLTAQRLQSRIAAMHADLRALRQGATLAQLLAARPSDAETIQWNAGLERDFLARTAASVNYLQVRLLDANGREVVRVERAEGGAQPRAVAGETLQDKQAREYFRAAARLPDGEVYTSPIEFNVEHGVVQYPLVPVIRAATPVRDTSGVLQGVLVINLDLRSYMALLRAEEDSVFQLFVADRDGRCVLDPAAIGSTAVTECALPHAAIPALRNPSLPRTGLVALAGSASFSYAIAAVAIAGVPTYSVVETAPLASLLAGATATQRRILLAGGAIALFALVIGALLARSLAVPIESMATAVARFDGRGELTLPPSRSVEVERLRLAFTEMAREVREREAAREHEERRFRQVVEHSPIGELVVDAAGRIQLANRRAEEMFGYAAGELLGTSIDALVPVRFSAGHGALRAAFLDAPTSRPMGVGRELYALRKDGGEFPVEVAINPLQTHDGINVLTSIIDISERKDAVEFMRRALREKEVLLREIYHRVKNNLLALGSLLALQERRAPEAAQAILRDSGARVQAMALAHEMLYRADDLSNIDFNAYVHELVAHIRTTHGVEPGTVEFHYQIDALPLEIDRAIPLGLILNELVVNCLKHAFPAGHRGRIEITAGRHADGRTYLTVGDDGVGMPEATNDSSRTTLGLTLVHALAGQLDARVDIEGGPGTVVRITF